MMWTNKTSKIGTTFIIFLLSFSVFGQESLENKKKDYTLSYPDFIDKLATQNLGYAAEQYNISIAEAEIEAAKIFPDPELSFTAYDNQERRMKMGYGFEAELEWDLELGGKRKARKKLALAERELAEMELIEYFKELRKSATIEFLKALRNRMHYDIEKKSYDRMRELSIQDSIRHKEGKISKSRANQSKLEVLAKYNHLQEVADDCRASLLNIKSLISSYKHDTVYTPTGDLKDFNRVFNLEELIESAKNNRTDVLITRHQLEISDNKVALEKAERVMDLGLSIGVENNSFAKNIIGPTPGHTAVFAGVSVPLQFSNNKDAGLKTAQFEKEQSILRHRQLTLNLEKEITEAYNDYITKQKQVKLIESSIDEAERIFEEEVENYLKDKTSLLEVLNAERTYSRIQNQYIHTLLKYAIALVDLESLAGIWDIDF
ncbi:MAG TPA: TolC family protein [Flavobacteriaceae bacterium]|nr:TolC family protein [Flavobacteriaceae bacterium]